MGISAGSKKNRYGYDTERHASSVIPYIGGKSALIDCIVPIIEYCADAYRLNSYFELCGGGGRMLLNLDQTLFQHRLYNDMDLGLCKLFACLGDRDDTYALIALLEELGYSEEVFHQAQQARDFESRMLARGRMDYELDRVTAAAYTFILATQSRAADMVKFDKARVLDQSRQQAYFQRVRMLDRFYPTLRDVEVTQSDCRELLSLYGGRGDAFAYLDPPYVPEKMQLDDHYGSRSWTVADHEQLVDILLDTNMKVALSGYDNECYAQLVVAGWRRLYLKDVHVSSAATGRRQDEYLWINFDIPVSLEDRVSKFDYSAW